MLDHMLCTQYLLWFHLLAQVLNFADNQALFEAADAASSFLAVRGLQYLDLLKYDLSGVLPIPLASSFSLQHVNLSSNAKLAGSLLEPWGRLTKLQIVDISGCGISGILPKSWATLQQLRVFRVGNNRSGVSGQLPGYLGKP